MKAAYFDKKKCITIREETMPSINSGQDVLIKIKYTGICGSDIHMYLGENPFVVYPRIFGHEFVGEVLQVGSAVTDIKPGDHVVGEPVVSCGVCYACRNGHPNVCEHLQVYGVHLHGGCQEYMCMPRDRVHRISEEVPWQCAVLAEPLTIGFRSCNRAQVLAGDYVLVQGSGTIGLCAMLAAKDRGGTVIMTDLYDEKLDYARKLGADYTINARKDPVEELLSQITGGMGPNVVLDAVGTRQSMEQAVEWASVAGRIVELGMGNISSQISHMKLAKRDLSLLGTRLQAYEFPETVAYLEKNWEKLVDFADHEYPISQVGEAIEHSIQNPQDVRKSLICFED